MTRYVIVSKAGLSQGPSFSIPTAPQGGMSELKPIQTPQTPQQTLSATSRISNIPSRMSAGLRNVGSRLSPLNRIPQSPAAHPSPVGRSISTAPTGFTGRGAVGNGNPSALPTEGPSKTYGVLGNGALVRNLGGAPNRNQLPVSRPGGNRDATNLGIENSIGYTLGDTAQVNPAFSGGGMRRPSFPQASVNRRQSMLARNHSEGLEDSMTEGAVAPGKYDKVHEEIADAPAWTPPADREVEREEYDYPRRERHFEEIPDAPQHTSSEPASAPTDLATEVATGEGPVLDPREEAPSPRLSRLQRFERGAMEGLGSVARMRNELDKFRGVDRAALQAQRNSTTPSADSEVSEGQRRMPGSPGARAGLNWKGTAALGAGAAAGGYLLSEHQRKKRKLDEKAMLMDRLMG